MRHSLPQVTVDKTKNYPTQLYGYLAIRFGQINIIYPQKSPASLEIQGLHGRAAQVFSSITETQLRKFSEQMIQQKYRST